VPLPYLYHSVYGTLTIAYNTLELTADVFLSIVFGGCAREEEGHAIARFLCCRRSTRYDHPSTRIRSARSFRTNRCLSL